MIILPLSVNGWSLASTAGAGGSGVGEEVAVGLAVGVAAGREVAVGLALGVGGTSVSVAPLRQAAKTRPMKMSKQIKLFRKRTILQTTQRCSGHYAEPTGQPGRIQPGGHTPGTTTALFIKWRIVEWF